MSVFSDWPRRYTVVALSFLAVTICYIDRVNISVAIIPMAEDLGWDLETRGIVLASFAAGYITLQIIGGRLADRFGGKVVLGVGVVLWSLFTLLTPPAAFLGLGALLIARIGLGAGEAVTYPSFFSLFGRWVPESERVRAVGLANSGIPLGTIFGLVVTPLVISAWGWEWAFYLFGLVGFVWFVPWWFLVHATPAQHPSISSAERALIEAEIPDREGEALPSLGSFLRSRSVWAIVVAHFCNNWSLYILITWLPTFVSEGLGVPFESVGWLTMIPHVASFIFINVAGQIADRMLAAGLPVVRVRKIMQTIGCFGTAISLLVVGQIETAWAAIVVMSIGTAVGAFVTGGFAVNHIDIAPRHAGTVMGLTNTAGTIPGMVGVYTTGMILQATGSWSLVFGVASGITLVGWLAFVLFASGEREFD
ncbi:MAG: ACS family MFS transporter [bacterium]|nr:ACS family MFS transporter [bacterium]